MKTIPHTVRMALVLATLLNLASLAAAQGIKEKALDAPNGVTVKIRMEGPYTADVPLQVVCYFKYTPERAKRMSGAPVELDKELGGVIASLRERGDFVGHEGETLLVIPPKNSIKAKALLLVGLGDEDSLSLKTMERVGTVSLREAAKLSANRVAFAPLLRDQGNSKLDVADVERAVLRGVLLAYDTEIRLQKEGLAKNYTLKEWLVEAGPMFFDATVPGAQKGIDDAKAAIGKRASGPYISGKK